MTHKFSGSASLWLSTVRCVALRLPIANLVVLGKVMDTARQLEDHDVLAGRETIPSRCTERDEHLADKNLYLHVLLIKLH